MIKLVVGLVKKDGMSIEAFEDHWHDEHAPRASEIPNLEKYTTGVALDPDESVYDGIAELYFESAGDIETAFDSEAGRWALDDLENFTETDENIQLVLDETVQVE